MPNTFLKPQVIAATALGLLQREIVLPGLISTLPGQVFQGALNDTVTVRVPGTLTARRRAVRNGGNITLDTVAETSIAVTLDTDHYSGVPVTDAELTLDIANFGVQILQPQVRAVAEDLENKLATTMAGGSYATGNTIAWTPADPYGALVKARQVLNAQNVPLTDRFVVVGSQVEADILNSTDFKQGGRSGEGVFQGQSALADAEVGRLAGFPVLVSNALDPKAAFAFHRSAYVGAFLAPAQPAGAAFGATAVAPGSGVALRWLRDYDFTSTTDRSLVDVYSGMGTVADGAGGKIIRAVKFTYPTA